MKNRAIKLIICICVISCLMVGFCSAFASAEPAWLIRAKAGVAAAMLASQLVTNPINVLLDDPIARSIDPVGKIEWVETFPEYLDRSTIKVLPHSVVIDGVSYSDIWLGPDAANKLRLQGLDFASAYNILSNQSEALSYAEGVGYASGVPMYSVDGSYVSQSYYAPFAPLIGDSVLYEIEDSLIVLNTKRQDFSRTRVDGAYTIDGSTPSSPSSIVVFLNENWNTENFLQIRPYGLNTYRWFSVNSQNTNRLSGPNVPFTSSPFSFDYTSGIIDAPIAENDGLLLRVPTEYTSSEHPEYNYDIHDLINIYPTVTQPGGKEINIDPTVNPDFQTDVDLGNNVADLIRIILSLLDLIDNIDVKFAPEPETPEPPPEPGQIDPLPDPDPAPDEPTSGTTIADTDWTKLDEILRWIQSTIDSIRHITESLQTMLDSLFDQLQQIIESLQSLPQQLLEDIETGPSKVFRKALDILKSLFMPLLLPIKAMMNLWHYVVEWIQSISSPFTWIFGIMSGTSYNMVLPIYAVLAGSICIAIYKALGR